MNDFGEAAWLALGMLGRLDPALLEIVALSLAVSLAAAAAAAAIGCPAGAALAIYRFRGRGGLVMLVNALLGLPPVVVGLAFYLLLTRRGVFGGLGLLYTPLAMVLVQTTLAVPIVTAIVHRALAVLWSQYGDQFQIEGARRLGAIPHLLAMGRDQVLTALLAGFGRTISEVGGIIIVGGNIAGATRTMTTAIVLETSKGDLPLALALGLVLVSICVAVNGLAFAIADRKRSR